MRPIKWLASVPPEFSHLIGYHGRNTPHTVGGSAMNGLDQAQLSLLQAMLEQRKVFLLSQLADKAAAAGAAGLNEMEASPADNANARTLNELVNEAAEHNAAQLRVVKHALGKFADGSYGVCENCGEPIGWSRLNARPEARFCIDCQTKIEKARR
jgi:DnaK suppressor protein